MSLSRERVGQMISWHPKAEVCAFAPICTHVCRAPRVLALRTVAGKEKDRNTCQRSQLEDSLVRPKAWFTVGPSVSIVPVLILVNTAGHTVEEARHGLGSLST